MSLLDMLRPSQMVAAFAEPDPVAVATTDTIVGRSITRAQLVAENIARSIPAVRKAEAVLAGTISTFALAAWEGDRRLPVDDPRSSWLTQPDPAATLQRILFHTIADGIWHGRSVWRILDRNVAGQPVKFRRINPRRISTISPWYDDEEVEEWIIDSETADARNLVIFDYGALGGLRRYGFDLLDLYGKLQAAAGNYAEAPHPKAILKNSGADLTGEEITTLLDDWEASRATRSVGYLNSVVEYDTYGWSADELQLTQAREYAALEVARLFGLPAKALDAESQNSMTYSNAVEARRDVLEALRPWMTVITQTLSLNDRSSRRRGLYLPAGVRAEFDADAYTRDAPTERIAMWSAAIAAGLLSPDEARRLEPLARGLGPTPQPVAGGAGETEQETIARTIQQIYLGVGTVLTVDEARQIVNTAGAQLPVPAPPELTAPEPPNPPEQTEPEQEPAA